mmetsp:Transcript_6093/g.12473  ORF Transcript_6093/g.12473 Transcript_6093/m.12473 type:complete len:98 (+) Transcript_6093:803-1096(+)
MVETRGSAVAMLRPLASVKKLQVLASKRQQPSGVMLSRTLMMRTVPELTHRLQVLDLLSLQEIPSTGIPPDLRLEQACRQLHLARQQDLPRQPLPHP